MRKSSCVVSTKILVNISRQSMTKKKWKKDDVIKFLQRRDLNLDLDNKDIKIIKSKKISGRALLCLTDEKLESYGPVVTIAELVKESKENTVSYNII